MIKPTRFGVVAVASVLFALAIGATASRAQQQQDEDQTSSSYWLPKCREYLKLTQRDEAALSEAQQCLAYIRRFTGALSMLLSSGKDASAARSLIDYCPPPEGVSPEQQARAFINYVEANPALADRPGKQHRIVVRPQNEKGRICRG